MKNPGFAISFVSLYLLVFALMGQWEGGQYYMPLMFLLSPFLVVWMVITVLRYGRHSGKELSENEEWGYEDKTF